MGMYFVDYAGKYYVGDYADGLTPVPQRPSNLHVWDFEQSQWDEKPSSYFMAPLEQVKIYFKQMLGELAASGLLTEEALGQITTLRSGVDLALKDYSDGDLPLAIVVPSVRGAINSAQLTPELEPYRTQLVEYIEGVLLPEA